jgi:ferredoxin
MSLFTIDPEKCNRDEICVKACPAKVIRMISPDGMPEASPDFEEYCLTCGHCVAVCPTEALSLNWLTPGNCPPLHKEISLTREQAEQFLRSRRSIRNFKDKPVEREKLEKLLEMACFAPSAKNNQPWHWTVVEDPIEVRRLAGMVIEWMRTIIEQHPKQAEQRGFVRVVSAWDAGEERICRGAPHIVVVHGDKHYGFGWEHYQFVNKKTRSK